MKGLGIGPVHFRHGMKFGNINDGEFRNVVNQLRPILDLNEHIPGKEIMPGAFGDDSDRHLILGVGPGIAILDKNILALEISQHPEIEDFKLFRIHGHVDRTPPDLFFAGLFPNDPFIVGRAPGMVPGSHDNRSHMGDDPFPAADDLFIEDRGRRIPVNSPYVFYPMMLQPVMGLRFS